MESLNQLPLDIQLVEQASFANFVTGENDLLIKALQTPADEQHWCIYCWGDIGRTHLLQATCQYAQQQQQTMMYLPLNDLQSLSPLVLENLEQYQWVALDNIDAVLNDHAWAEQLFYLYNRLNEKGHKLIISSRYSVKQTECVLQDLKSRLSAAAIFSIKPLNDAGKKQALMQRAKQVGLVLNDDVTEFLLRRYSRRLTDLFLALEKLDQASMVLKRKLTVPFIKFVLQLNN